MMELLRISYPWNRRRLERETAEEMAYNRELMLPDRRTNFGDDLRLREDAREIWGRTWLDRLHQDLTYGARVLRNAPGFTHGDAGSGSGYRRPVERLSCGAYRASRRVGTGPGFARASDATRPGAHMTSVTYPELTFYAANATSFRSVIGISKGNQAVFSEASVSSTPKPIHVAFATANYFPEFGIAPALGRALTPDDKRPDAEPAALIGELFWQRRLGADPAVIGRSIRLNGKLLRVVGVMPRSSQTRDEIWMPLVQQPYVVEGSTLLTNWNSALEPARASRDWRRPRRATAAPEPWRSGQS
jgi:hypothetical protein